MGMTSLMDLQYDEEIVDRVRQLAPRFAERAEDIDRKARFPVENFGELRDAGLNAVCIPKEWGGAGAKAHRHAPGRLWDGYTILRLSPTHQIGKASGRGRG